MNTKNLVGLCVMLAFIAIPVAFTLNPILMRGQEPVFIGYEAEFVGQDTAEVGELVRFLAEGDLVRWECLPKTSDSESYGEHNENYVVSFRKPGVYTVVAAIYAGGELTIHTQAVTVEGPPPPPPPTPTPTPVKVDVDLEQKVLGWAKKYQVDRDTCISLSSNFSTVAKRIESGELITPGQIITATANLNSDLKLNEGLMAELQAYLTSQADMGNLRTTEQHLVVWNSIAKGLKDAAS
jgi:hypothetical protein